MRQNGSTHRVTATTAFANSMPSQQLDSVEKKASTWWGIKKKTTDAWESFINTFNDPVFYSVRFTGFTG